MSRHPDWLRAERAEMEAFLAYRSEASQMAMSQQEIVVARFARHRSPTRYVISHVSPTACLTRRHVLISYMISQGSVIVLPCHCPATATARSSLLNLVKYPTTLYHGTSAGGPASFAADFRSCAAELLVGRPWLKETASTSHAPGS